MPPSAFTVMELKIAMENIIRKIKGLRRGFMLTSLAVYLVIIPFWQTNDGLVPWCHIIVFWLSMAFKPHLNRVLYFLWDMVFSLNLYHFSFELTQVLSSQRNEAWSRLERFYSLLSTNPFMLYDQIQYPSFAGGIGRRVWNIKLFNSQAVGCTWFEIKTFNVPIK